MASSEKRQVPIRVSNFNDRVTFPAARELPLRSRQVQTAHTDSSGEPRILWCLIVEVVTCDSLSPLGLTCLDRDSQRVHLRFQDQPRYGSNLHHGRSINQIVVVLGAYKDNDNSVTVDNFAKVRKFPISMFNFMALGERVGNCLGLSGSSQRCYCCGSVESRIDMCSNCNLLWFCSNSCLGMDRSGVAYHLAECQRFRDESFRKLFILDWDVPGGGLVFPL